MPQCVSEISAVEWASGLMLIMQPRSSARSCQTPIEVKPRGICIDLHGNLMLGAGFQDLFHIDFVARTAE